MNYSRSTKTIALAVALSFSFNPILRAADDGLPVHDCGKPPPAPPQFHAGGEGFPPLPLPATPLRRSEKKKPPAPPNGMAKLKYGKESSWNPDPGAHIQLMNHVGQKISGSRYTFSVVGPEGFTFDPKEVPVLFFSATEAFQFSPDVRKKLREYCEKGGTLFLEANSGTDPARASFTAELKAIFPDKVLRRLPIEHPVFTSSELISSVKYLSTTDKVPDQLPYLEGVDIGTRTVVFYSRYGLSCAWEGHTHPGNRGLGRDSALAVGLNVMAYAMSEQNTPKPLAETVVYTDDPSQPRARIAIGQIVHNGEWNATPAGVAAMMQQAVQKLNLRGQLQATPVNLAKDDVLGYPMLFMSGMYDFTFSEQEAAALRAYLQGGGFLFAESCGGRGSFEVAFGREMKKVLADRPLQTLPSSDPVYTTYTNIGTVNYDQRLALKSSSGSPSLEGIRFEGRTVVVFSKYSLSTGWEGNASPFNSALTPDDALRVGLNVIAYAMTH